MISMQRTVQTTAAPKAVFEYLADFTTAEQWDPNADKVVRLSGHGAVGTVYRVSSRFAGRTTDLDYRLTDLDPDTLIRLRGEKKSVTAVDTIVVAPVSSGATVTYSVAFDFHGALRFAEPVLKYAVRRLLNQGAEGLTAKLEELAAGQA